MENAPGHDDSLENSEESSEEDFAKGDSEEIIQKVFGSYDLGGRSGIDARTREALIQSFGGSSGSCLICISDVKRKDAIWNCGECYCVFHMQCIQRWSRDSIFQQKNELENESGKKNFYII